MVNRVICKLLVEHPRCDRSRQKTAGAPVPAPSPALRKPVRQVRVFTCQVSGNRKSLRYQRKDFNLPETRNHDFLRIIPMFTKVISGRKNDTLTQVKRRQRDQARNPTFSDWRMVPLLEADDLLSPRGGNATRFTLGNPEKILSDARSLIGSAVVC
jgi:hypothetical protein